MEVVKTELKLPDHQGQNLNKLAFILDNVFSD